MAKKISGVIHFVCPSVEGDAYPVAEALLERLHADGWDAKELTVLYRRKDSPDGNR